MENILRRFLIVIYFLSVACGLLSYRAIDTIAENRVALMRMHDEERESYYRLDPNRGEFPKGRRDFFEQKQQQKEREQGIAASVFLSTFGVVACCFLSHFIFFGILNPLRLFKSVSD
jgi:hypothetical protein